MTGIPRWQKVIGIFLHLKMDAAQKVEQWTIDLINPGLNPAERHFFKFPLSFPLKKRNKLIEEGCSKNWIKCRLIEVAEVSGGE